MQAFSIRWLAAALLLLVGAGAGAQAPTQWVAGKHYFLVAGPQQVSVAPGKVEVTEVFSYGCPACNAFYPTMEKLSKSLPTNTEVVFVHASFIPEEQWPMFQRAYYTAQVLKVAEQTHKAMFDAVWKGGELALVDPKTRKRNKPTIEDAAKFYKRVAGIDPQKFLSVAKGFTVEGKVRRADKLVRAYGADSTPTIVVNGRYRLTAASAGGEQQLIDLVNWLVAKETLQRSASVSH